MAPHLQSLGAVGALLTLTVASYLDLRYRDIEPIYWYVTARILAVLGIVGLMAGGYTRIELVACCIGNCAALAVTAGAYLAGLLGGGDLAATVLIALSTPLWGVSLLPPALLAILYGSLAALTYTLYYCITNIVFYRRSLASLARRRGVTRAIIACFIYRPLRVEEAQARGWLYPASWEVGSYRLVEADPPELLAVVASRRGGNGVVWVTPGLPQVVFITLGYVVALILGDAPIRVLLSTS